MRTFALLATILFVACGPADRGDDTGGNGNGPDGGGGGGGGGSGGGSNTEGCSDAAKLVYVVDSGKKFSKFDPSTKMFTDIGTLNCPGTSGQPFSMGVDRDAVAWVLYSDHKIFRVDTSNAACTATNFSAPSNLQLFGMGFSANTAGSTDDTLFIAGGPDPGPLGTMGTTSALSTMSTMTMSPMSVGTVTGWPELTGTGNAELWGWFPDASNPRVEQLNKTSGAAVKTFSKSNAPTMSALTGTPAAWAFAFWGGDFWVFLQKQSGLSTEPNTKVYQIDGMTGAIKTTTDATGRIIVGAGVSTCAPVVIL